MRRDSSATSRWRLTTSWTDAVFATHRGRLLAPRTILYILQATGHTGAVVIQFIAGWYGIGARSWLSIDPVTPADRTESHHEQRPESA